MNVAEFFRPASIAPVPSNAFAEDTVRPADCAERFRLRREYIQRLAEFNQAAARHKLVLRAGMDNAAAGKSWRAFQESCVASRDAWARYRRHLAAHACKCPSTYLHKSE